MRTAPYEARGGTRTMTGTVSGTGAVVAGGTADWTVTRISAGVYVIRFFPAFRSVPVVTVQVWLLGFPYLVSAAADNCQINIYNPAQANVDGQFSFQIEGRPL